MSVQETTQPKPYAEVERNLSNMAISDLPLASNAGQSKSARPEIPAAFKVSPSINTGW
jgi:hypothetical protein